MAVAKTTNEVKLAIERKTAKTLPDQPTARGYKAATIKGALYKWLSDPTNSLFAELDRIVDAFNSEIADVVDGSTPIDYDNDVSELVATTVQGALDEIDGNVDTNAEAIANIIAGITDIVFSNTVSGLTAETVKAAIDEITAWLDDLMDGTQIVDKATKDANGDTISSTYEKVANKKTTLADNSDTYYPTQKAVKTAVDLKVDKTLTILGIDHQNDITLTEFKTALGNATTELAGLMSATDKTHLEALYALLGAEADVDEIANTINEILAIFEDYPEGADLVTALAGKVDKVEGKELSDNNYTDAEVAKVGHLPADFETFMTDYYTKTEVDTLLDALTTAYGLTETEIDELADDDTIALADLTDYDYITLILKHSDTHLIFDGKLIDPAVFTNNGDFIQLNAFEGGTQHSYGTLTYDGSTNLTFEASDASDTLIVKGYKKDAVTDLLVESSHTGTTYLDGNASVHADTEDLDVAVKAIADDIADLTDGTVDIVYDNATSGMTATTHKAAIDELSAEITGIKADYVTKAEYGMAKEYGVRWVETATSTTLERVTRINGVTKYGTETGLAAAVATDDAVVYNSFDYIPIFSRNKVTITAAEGENSVTNDFVEVKKYFIKEEIVDEDGTDYHYIWMCEEPIDSDYRLPLPFVKEDGLPREFAYIGCYEASLDGTKLRSISGVFPKVTYSRADFRTAARALDGLSTASKYQITDLAEYVDLVQIPFMIEFATKDAQSIFKGATSMAYSNDHLATADGASVEGASTILVANATAAAFILGQTIGIGTARGGNQIATDRVITAIDADTPGAGTTTITFDGAAVATLTGHFVYTLGWKTGKTDSVKISGYDSANDSKHPFKWRHMENPFGNIWKNIDGVKISNYVAWVCEDATAYNDTASSSGDYVFPYVKLNYTNASANNFVQTLGIDDRFPFAQFPTVVQSSSANYYKDYYYQASGDRTVFVGGRWYDGGAAGLFFWFLDNGLGYTSIHLGARLSYRP